jgi:flagellar motor component MotA
MKKMYFLVGILALLLIGFAVFVSGGSILWVLDLPSLIMVTLFAFFLSLSNFSPKEIAGFYSLAFKKDSGNRKELMRGINYFESMKVYILSSGILGTVIGFIAILGDLSDKSKFGMALSLTLITLLYGILLFNIVVIPFRTALKNRLAELEG